MLLKSPTNHLSRRFKLRRSIVAVVLLILFYALVIALFTLLGAKLGSAATDGFKALPSFYSSTIEPALYQVQSWLSGFIQRLDPTLQSMLTSLNQNIVTSLGSAVSSLSSSAVSSLTGFASHDNQVGIFGQRRFGFFFCFNIRYYGKVMYPFVVRCINYFKYVQTGAKKPRWPQLLAGHRGSLFL